LATVSAAAAAAAARLLAVWPRWLLLLLLLLLLGCDGVVGFCSAVAASSPAYSGVPYSPPAPILPLIASPLNPNEEDDAEVRS
jgi:hypothetical protein